MLFSVGLSLFSSLSAADVIDDEMQAGNRAFGAGDVETAIESYERARQLLPGSSAKLSYNLGTAYAKRGSLGQAVFHLRQSLQPHADATAEIRDAAQRNLGIVRRRAEIQAAASGAQLSANEDWREFMASILASRLIGWISLVSAWLALFIYCFRKIRNRSQERGLSALLQYCLLGMYIGLGGLHLLANGASYRSNEAIAIASTAEVRDGPGLHRKVVFLLQGGSRVMVEENGAGWSKVRVPGGLEGWIGKSSIALLDDQSDGRGRPVKSEDVGGQLIKSVPPG